MGLLSERRTKADETDIGMGVFGGGRIFDSGNGFCPEQHGSAASKTLTKTLALNHDATCAA
jgi:hypothetical protein